MKLDPITREKLAQLNEQDWQDFRAHWPMRVFQFVSEMVGGFLFGVALALAVFIWGLQCVAEVL